ncbi:hypothetical protein [Pseudoduganella sp. GCM10020061]|uniref:hypothetical protein n=1 Tax=Pseudoduganella sp. GCM10020061 TaxID=3317345 RepID=UPI0036347F30
MKTPTTCLLVALLSAVGAGAQAERRPDWEQALALAPMIDGALPLSAFGLARIEADAAAMDDPVLDDIPPEASAELVQVDADGVPDGWEAVDGAALDGMRGGFTDTRGLVVSLGVERLVSINGELVASTRFELPNAGSVAGDAAHAARDALNSGGLIQNGPGNIAPVFSPDMLGATVIQNTLNDQTIRSQTIINASVNSATLMQSLNFNDSVGQAIRDAVRLH